MLADRPRGFLRPGGEWRARRRRGSRRQERVHLRLHLKAAGFQARANKRSRAQGLSSPSLSLACAAYILVFCGSPYSIALLQQKLNYICMRTTFNQGQAKSEIEWMEEGYLAKIVHGDCANEIKVGEVYIYCPKKV